MMIAKITFITLESRFSPPLRANIQYLIKSKCFGWFYARNKLERNL